MTGFVNIIQLPEFYSKWRFWGLSSGTEPIDKDMDYLPVSEVTQYTIYKPAAISETSS
jgi:hypothetical protein